MPSESPAVITRRRPVSVTSVTVPLTTLLPTLRTLRITHSGVLPPVRINACEYLSNRFVGHSDGRRIYPHIRSALLSGRRVVLSVAGLHVFGGFWDTAICQAYGEFPESTVDGDIEVIDVPKSSMISLRNMKEVRKLYYYDRASFDARISDVDPCLGFGEGVVSEAEFIPGVDDADYNNN
jgi:hypothetical protein